VAEQHLQPLGAALKVGAVYLRVPAWTGLPPRRQVLVSFHALPRLRAFVPCRSLLHLVPSLLGIESILPNEPPGSAAA
jgi:hypothetical protein